MLFQKVILFHFLSPEEIEDSWSSYSKRDYYLYLDIIMKSLPWSLPALIIIIIIYIH